MFSKNKVGKHLQVWMVLVFKLLNKSWYLGIKKQGLISWTTANSPMGSLDFLKVCMCFFHVIIFQWCCNVIMWPRARGGQGGQEMYECHVIFDPKSCHVYRLLQSSSKVLGPKIHLNQVIRYNNMPDRRQRWPFLVEHFRNKPRTQSGNSI